MTDVPPKPKTPLCAFVVGGQVCGVPATAQKVGAGDPLPLCAWHATRFPGATTTLPQ